MGNDKHKLQWSHRYIPYQGDLWTFGPYQIQELTGKIFNVTAGDKHIGQYTNWDDATRAVAEHVCTIPKGPKRYASGSGDRPQAALGAAIIIALLIVFGWLIYWTGLGGWLSWAVGTGVGWLIAGSAWAGVVILAIVALCVVVCVLGNGWQRLSKWLERHL
jgi:hypothetical protein